MSLGALIMISGKHMSADASKVDCRTLADMVDVCKDMRIDCKPFREMFAKRCTTSVTPRVNMK